MAHPRDARLATVGTLSRWDPFRDLELLTPFDRVFGESHLANRTRQMPVDVIETDDHYLVSVS